MKVLNNLRDYVKDALEKRIGIRMINGYDDLYDKKDGIEKIKQEVIEMIAVLGNPIEVKAILEDLLQKDKDCIKWLKLAKLYGGMK